MPPPRAPAVTLTAAQERLGDALTAACRLWDGGITPVDDSATPDDLPPWQLTLTRVGPALRMCIYVRARLLAGGDVDSRVAVAIDASSGDANAENARASARRGLAALPRHSNLAIVVPATEASAPLAGWLSASADLLDALMRRWTARQAEIVSMAIVPGEQRYEDVAERLGITKQAVGKALSSAGWGPVRSALRVFEGSDWSTLCQARGSGPRPAGER